MQMSKGCLTSEAADQLLDKLSTDHQYREHFLGNPALVLAHHGVTVDPTQIPTIRRLPSKEVLKANKQAIKEKIVGNAGLPLFMLDV
jgi:putative modified peptide